MLTYLISVTPIDDVADDYPYIARDTSGAMLVFGNYVGLVAACDGCDVPDIAREHDCVALDCAEFAAMARRADTAAIEALYERAPDVADCIGSTLAFVDATLARCAKVGKLMVVVRRPVYNELVAIAPRNN